MSSTSERLPNANAGTTGVFNYLADSVDHSLYRNGQVLTRRDANGSDAGTEGVVTSALEVTVLTARSLRAEQKRTLKTHGFELVAHPLSEPDLDFHDHIQVVQRYYPECAELVQRTTGAAFVAAFDHNVRSAAGKASQERIAGGQQVQGPAHIVHGDYTLTSAPQRLRDLTKPPGRNDTLRHRLLDGEALVEHAQAERALDRDARFAIINVWRSIAAEPVASNPLALCDGQCVRPEELVVFEIHYADRIGENYFAKHAPHHRWYYYPQMTRDEALLIKQWDSAGALARSEGVRADASSPQGPCTFSFHSAFKDPQTPPDAPDRRSIEVRCIALYD